MNFHWFFLFLSGVVLVHCLPDQGKWDFTINEAGKPVGVYKSLYRDSDVIIQVACSNPSVNITIGWLLRETPCWNEYVYIGNEGIPASNLSYVYNNPGVLPNPMLYNRSWYYQYREHAFMCDGGIVLPDMGKDNGKSSSSPTTAASKQATVAGEAATPAGTTLEKMPTPLPLARVQRGSPQPRRQYRVPADGLYLLVVRVMWRDSAALQHHPLNISVHLEMSSPQGYLSAVDWPLLPFYSCMCALYALYALGWLLVCARQWRELLRIQFWIGAVIAMGMLEKAVFLAEYESVNRSGRSVHGAVVFAELVSCAKRALARMLVIIVSLGFGITKPRLGPLLHRVMAVGLLSFMFLSIEGCTRALKPKNDVSGGTLGTSVVLALLDSAICWWVFSALLSTTRTLRLRRNEVKLTLYRHFTNTLILAVLASVGFMIYQVKFHRAAACLNQWKNLWVDEACWHVLFSMILLVIMLLWRPTNNNQRYAFTPLLDAGDEDEEDELFRSDAYHDLKMRARSPSGGSRAASRRSRDSDDDLKWVEENIPASLGETALPVMDSDEEIMQAKFEISKMQ